MRCCSSELLRYRLPRSAFPKIFKLYKLYLNGSSDYLQLINSDISSAGEKAKDHLTRAVKTAKEIGVKNILGHTYLNLGLLYKAKGQIDQARRWISESAQIFEQCEIQLFLKQTKEVLNSL